MNTTINKTPRLGDAIKEFNVGRETLIDFLNEKGFDIKGANPGTKLTEGMYSALQVEFAQDKLAKRRSDEIALPKGSLMDNLRKPKEPEIFAKDIKKEEPKPQPAEVKPQPPIRRDIPGVINVRPIHHAKVKFAAPELRNIKGHTDWIGGPQFLFNSPLRIHEIGLGKNLVNHIGGVVEIKPRPAPFDVGEFQQEIRFASEFGGRAICLY